MQARYYAKLYNHDPLKDFPAKLDTDRGIIRYCRDRCYYDVNNYFNEDWLMIFLTLFLNMLIAIFGIYCLNLTITEYESYQHNNSSRRINSIYWASVTISGAINIACLVIDIRWFVQNPNFLFLAIRLTSSPSRNCCCVHSCKEIQNFFMCVWLLFKTLVMRLVHTLAICHLLWFLHRVGFGLIVAAFFIALAPGQTIAALSLMYLVILVSTVYVACCIYTLQNCRKKCKMVCKLFLLTITYLCLVGLAIVFTVVYNYYSLSECPYIFNHWEHIAIFYSSYGHLLY